MTTQFTLTRARAGKSLAVIATPDEMEPYYPLAHFCFYVPTDPPNDRWGGRDLDMRVHGIEVFARKGAMRKFCVISAEGDVAFMDDPIVIEKIPGAGIQSPDSKFWGRMENIAAIGEHLYACGDAGQIYKRSVDGVWSNLDPTLLQDTSVPLAERDIFLCIDGPSEDQIYIVGRFGKVLFWNGVFLEQVSSGTTAMLINIHVENADKIWICGGDGTLLCGNHRDGFRQAPGVDGGQLFQSVTRFQDKIYLGAGAGRPMGLLVYDGVSVEEVSTGLPHGVTDSHSVDAANGVLWSVGLKDIVRFDGQTWERIDFPSNTPIR